MSDSIVKKLNFGDKAREQVFKGITKLTNAVSSTLGASGKCVMLEDATGKPIITKDGVTVADSIILRDPVENMGATLLKEAARIARDAEIKREKKPEAEAPKAEENVCEPCEAPVS